MVVSTAVVTVSMLVWIAVASALSGGWTTVDRIFDEPVVDVSATPTARTAGLDQRQALEQFLAGVERRALRMAGIATGNTEEALDIVQNAMLKLVQRYGTRPAEEWGPLFQRILQSKIRDWHRRAKIRHYLRVWLEPGNEDDEGGIESLVDVTARDPARETQTDTTLAVLERALNALPLRQQQVFLLRVWEGLDVAQTARVMGCSQGSVKTHYFRAVQKLRQVLGEHWP